MNRRIFNILYVDVANMHKALLPHTEVLSWKRMTDDLSWELFFLVNLKGKWTDKLWVIQIWLLADNFSEMST